MADHLRFACRTGTRSTRRASTSSARARSTALEPDRAGRASPMDGRRRRRWTSRSSSSRSSGRRSSRFHDLDIAPEGSTFAESCRNLDEMVELAAGTHGAHGRPAAVGHRQCVLAPPVQAGAATNPDPDLFRYAAAQVAHCLDATHRLGGANYVLWGGREGYETLLNTDMRRELDQLGRFLNLVVEHKHAIGFEGTAPDRAEADRADEAPVRLRRRRRARVPAEVRARGRDQGQHRGQPRHAGRPRLPPRGRRGRQRRHLRLDRRQRRRRPARLGPRPVPDVGRADDARDARDPAGRRVHDRAG